MRFNYEFNNLTEALPSMFRHLLQDGAEVGSRNGRTKELAFTGITIEDGTSREILIPGRKHNLAAQIAETMWVLAGRNDMEFLTRYLPRATDYSDDGLKWRGGYGPRLRTWGLDFGDAVDQVEHCVNLLRASPATRQAVIGIYDPLVDTEPGLDIPCNDFLHFLSRDGYLNLHIFVRSNDAMWGWSGINVFEWSSLLEIVAGMTGLNVGALHFSVSSFHLYEQHWEKAEQIAADDYATGWLKPSPRFDPTSVDDGDSLHALTHMWFIAEQAIREGSTLARNYVEDFPEPMMQSWLRVIQWWWSGDPEYLAPLAGTALGYSASIAVQPKMTEATLAPEGENPEPLIERIITLHNEKDAAYGDSWCKRGEMLGIMANIARKVDRLGGGETADETSLDTAMDLFVYLAKYKAWIRSGGPDRDGANAIMRVVAESVGVPASAKRDYLIENIKGGFDLLEDAVVADGHRTGRINDLLEWAWELVYTLDEA
jgi:thymidylate synthase